MVWTDHEVEEILHSPQKGESVKIIVGYTGSLDSVKENIENYGGTIESELPYNSLIVNITERKIGGIVKIDSIESVEVLKTVDAHSTHFHNIPRSMTSSNKSFKTHVFNSYYSSLRVPEANVENLTGSGTKIGIIDSIWHPPRTSAGAPFSTYSNTKIGNLHSWIESPCHDPHGHGTWIFDIISKIAPDAEFSFYQILDSDRQGKAVGNSANLIEAIKSAEEDGVDILNISCGVWDRGCDSNCRISYAVQQATHNGITILSSIGNKEVRIQQNHRGELSRKHTYCPALSQKAIGVGGFVSLCHEQQPYSNTDQIWADTTRVEEVQDEELQGIFCGYGSCYPNVDCREKKIEEAWQGNVPTRNDRPLVLAPVYYPTKTEDMWYFQRGTSYSTAIISGILALINEELEGFHPIPPNLWRMASEIGATKISGGQKFDAVNTLVEMEDVLSRST